MTDKNKTDLAEQLEKALVLLQNQGVDAAIAIFQKILSHSPQQPDALHGMGLAYAQLRDFSKATQYFEQAVAIVPHIAEFHNNLANALKATGRIDKSLQHYREALRLKSPYPQAQNNLGTLLYRIGQYSEAASILEKSVRMDPKAVDTHYNLANCYIQLDRWLDAAAHYKEVLKLRSEHLGALHNLGITLCSLKQFEEAKPLLKQVIEREPNNIDALFHLSVIYSALGETMLAKECYEKILTLAPNHANSHHNIATLYLHLNQPEKALSHYQTALKLEPDNKTARHMIDALLGKTSTEGAPPEYVRALFDQYAYNYNQHVKDKLHYQVPHLLRSAITPYLSTQMTPWQVLDLGCGTGLCAPLFADITGKMIGVDVSPNMIEVAKYEGGYHKLYAMDILSYLNTTQDKFDLILSADVFVYFASLQEVFQACRLVLKPHGLFAFSIENLAEPQDFLLKKTGRYAHSFDYIQKLCKLTHFSIESENEVILRYQDENPVIGKILILRKIE